MAKLSILYVEDEPVVRENISQFLNRRFRHLHVAENGKEGLNLYKAKKPHIVMTDIKMPIMDGLEMTRQIRAINPDAQIIVTTAHSETDLLIKAIDVGVSQFVIKPLTRQKIFAAIGRVLHTIVLQERDNYKNRLMQKILDTQDNLLVVIGDKGITAANESALRFFGYRTVKDMTEDTMAIRSAVREEDGYFVPSNDTWYKDVHGACKIILHDQHSRQDKVFVLRVNHFPQGENHYILSFTDMTDIEEHNRELERLTTTDPVTGICNRARLSQILEKESHMARRYKTKLALVMFSVDYRDDMDISLGRENSDEVLAELSTLVSKSIRGFDTVGRWGDEEFIILAPNSDINVIQNLAHRLRDSINKHRFPFVEHITCSFGIAELSSEDDSNTLIRKASEAMRCAMEHGVGTIVNATTMEVVNSSIETLKEQEVVLKTFDLIKTRNEPVTLHNLYRGLSIKESARIHHTSERDVELILSPKQFVAMFFEKKGYIESSYFTKPVLAHLKSYHKDERRVTLRSFSLEDNPATQRQYVRVQVPDRVRVKLSYENKQLNEKVFDLSLQALAFFTSSTAWLREGMDVKLSINLSLPGADDHSENFQTTGRIYRVEGEAKVSKVVVKFVTDNPGRELLREYIAQRQLEIVREMNSALM
nr:response regulator [Desulfurispira natronophila]